MAKMIGSINCFVPTKGRVGRTFFEFDGTLKGLAATVVAKGLPLGARIEVPEWQSFYTLDLSNPGRPWPVKMR